MNNIFWVVIVSAITLIFAIVTKKKVLQGQISSESLTQGEKIITWVLCIVDPVIAGAILYYTWKKILPQKAKQANKISWVATILGILLAAYLFANGIL